MRIAVSPCSNPELELDPLLKAYSDCGYRRLEQFTGWVKSAFDYRTDPEIYRRKLKSYGISMSSLHLPAIGEDIESSLDEAVEAAAFAEAIGANVVLFKAQSRSLYIEAAQPFLDAIAHLNITPVLQNHAGSAISSLEDFSEVMEGIGDQRMKSLLEVGHFHSVGVKWEQGYSLLKDSIALVHIKDQIGSQSVPFGTGEVDLSGLLQKLTQDGYQGDLVIEMEVKDKENTIEYLADAHRYVSEQLDRIKTRG